MTGSEPSVSPIRQLRDAFGDPKPPDISRKITACVACRKQKIKCHMNDSRPPCVRCAKKGLSCVVNRSLQTLLESDALWKQTVEQKLQRLEATTGATVSHEASSAFSRKDEQAVENGSISGTERNVEEQQDYLHTPNDGMSQWKIVMDMESTPGALPGYHLFPTASSRPSMPQRDIISRGIIGMENAETYSNAYKNRLDHFVYHILGDYSTASLEDIRKASPLLTAAVCAVGALHLASPDYELLYKEFVALSAALSFSRKNTVNDVRALCIGAFWLSDLSWSLVGIAVRIAAELQLHKSFYKALQGDPEQYSQTRLYLLVYVCDHHYSVPYGKPPITRECEAVRDARKLLTCDFATEDDARLVSQVLRWSICSNVYDTFGADADRPIWDGELPHIRRFSISLDSLHAEWADRFGMNAHVGNYPRKGVGLQHQFARLYLCSHALRGISSNHTKHRSPDVKWELDDIASSAVLSAVSILRAVVSDTEIQSYLNGLPTYFDIMIAFAAVFLLKVSTKFSASVQFDAEEIQRLINVLVTVLREVTSNMHPHHLLVSISKGIDGLLHRCGMASGPVPADATVTPQQGLPQVAPELDVLHGDLSLADQTFGQYFMSEYDFLLGQDHVSLP